MNIVRAIRLRLRIVEVCRIERRNAVELVEGGKPWRIRNLKLIGGGAEHHAQAHERIDHVRQVTERVALSGLIVQRIRG